MNLFSLYSKCNDDNNGDDNTNVDRLFNESSYVSHNILGKSSDRIEAKRRPCKRLLNTASTLGNHILRVMR